MTEYLGKLIYAQPTRQGFLVALFDAAFMVVYLLGALGALYISGQYTSSVNALWAAWFALGLFLLERFIGIFIRLVKPDGHYEYRRKFVKEDGTVREMVGVDVYNSEWDE